MDVSKILKEIDTEVARLQQLRSHIASLEGGVSVEPKRRGRPKGSVNATPAKPAKRKRNLSPEGRKRIADAMKRRWAERRATPGAAKKEAAKK